MAKSFLKLAVLHLSVVVSLSGCFQSVGSIQSPLGVPRDYQIDSSNSIKTIRFDQGGKIVRYALDVARTRRLGQTVRFSGRCDSACTLYLSLPESQICVMPGASFGFHKPYGSSVHQHEMARDYLMKKYPQWVKDWLETHGGLKANIKRIGYASARKHIRTCEVGIPA